MAFCYWKRHNSQLAHWVTKTIFTCFTAYSFSLLRLTTAECSTYSLSKHSKHYHFAFLLLQLHPKCCYKHACVVRALPDYRLWCRVTGTTPIHTALVRMKKSKNIVVVNTTDTANIQLTRQGNYSCVASKKYGTDVKEFSVIFAGEKCLRRYIQNVISSLGYTCETEFGWWSAWISAIS